MRITGGSHVTREKQSCCELLSKIVRASDKNELTLSESRFPSTVAVQLVKIPNLAG